MFINDLYMAEVEYAEDLRMREYEYDELLREMEYRYDEEYEKSFAEDYEYYKEMN